MPLYVPAGIVRSVQLVPFVEVRQIFTPMAATVDCEAELSTSVLTIPVMTLLVPSTETAAKRDN